MEYIINFLNSLLPLLYFITTFCYGKFFYRHDKWAEKWMGPFLWTTVSLHLIELVLRGVHYSHHPITSVFEAASALAFSIVILYIYVEFRLQVKSTGYFILVFVFFLQFFSSSFIALNPSVPKTLRGSLFIFHTSAGVLGYASLVLSAIYSFLYLLLFYDIKKSRFSVLYDRLPPLEILQEMNLKTAKVGFLFFGLSLILGVIWAHRIGEGSLWDMKILAVYGACLIYAIEIIGARLGRWSGKKLAYLSLGGMALLMFSLVIVNLYLTSFHTFK